MKTETVSTDHLSWTPYLAVKRAADVIFSSIGIVILFLPGLLIAAVIACESRGPVLFSQRRVGRYGREFRIYKFRTMHVETPKYRSTEELENSGQYITSVGHFLRKFSLDELPQLINVWKGDMSLIGPRPLIAEETEIHRLRLENGVYQVRPGITGLAQINGRDRVSTEEKVRMDREYVEHFGMKEDLGILFATIPKLLSGEDVVER